MLSVILLGSCSEESSSPTVDAPATTTQESKAAPSEPAREFPRLSSKNAKDFFLEYGKNNPETKVKITTRLGDIKIRLYEETPLHRASFIFLTKQGYYNDTYFYRVVQKFIVQGGDTDREVTAMKRDDIGQYTLPNEIQEGLYHKKGAVCTARSWDNNPLKVSDPFNFYLVHGEQLHDDYLNRLERQDGKKFTPKQREVYSTVGGCAHLDGEHTVFGEIYEGFDVLDAIAAEEIDDVEWPKEDIVMQVEVIE